MKAGIERVYVATDNKERENLGKQTTLEVLRRPTERRLPARRARVTNKNAASSSHSVTGHVRSLKAQRLPHTANVGGHRQLAAAVIFFLSSVDVLAFTPADRLVFIRSSKVNCAVHCGK